MAFADTAARKLLHGGSGGTISQGVAEAGSISFFLHTFVSSSAGFFHRTFVHQFAALACAAHKMPQNLEELRRWLQAPTTVALPSVLGVIAVLLFVALTWFCWSTLRRCASSPWGFARRLCTPSATSGTTCTASPRRSSGHSPDSCLLPPCA
ncbi:hypothetical protein PVAP13_6KG100800 [Panicum virgatum]|uniref:Uncharacterized protein n=1 Tax=Panicum virgatum TaxID=38727 RepID=A0A8T0RC54_PANVG|nr:hypothetical protein PVAP13_6KG100800 [Panicum virgatum]